MAGDDSRTASERVAECRLQSERLESIVPNRLNTAEDTCAALESGSSLVDVLTAKSPR